MSSTPASVSGATWLLAPAALPRLSGGGLLLVVGLLTGRADVAALGVPLLLSVAWGISRRPVTTTVATLSEPRHVSRPSRIEATLGLDPAPGVESARLCVSAPEHRDVEVLVDARKRRELPVSLATARTGRQDVFRTDRMDVSSGGVLRAHPTAIGAATVVVLPQASPLNELPLPPRLHGLTGSHRSSQPGDGGELRDIAVFGPGDRLRRIDWKATARRAGSGGGHGGVTDLYVRRTFATSDAHVLLVLDARDEVGPEVTTWDHGDVHPDDATSLDTARRAAASLARRYLDQGDRVGLVELGGRGRRLRPGGGRRHLDQLVHHLALAAPEGRPAALARAPQIPSNALVLVFSTFLDDEAAQLARRWRYAGHRTAAVDVAPAAATAALPPQLRTAYRIVQMEREDRLASLEAAGVDVVRWSGDPDEEGKVAVVLAALTRTRRAGR